MRLLPLALASALVSAAFFVACGSNDEGGGNPTPDGSAPTGDAPLSDGGTTTPDTSANGDAATAATYNAITDTARWSSFQPSKSISTSARGLFGGVTDGRYVYFVPGLDSNGGQFYRSLALRYDPQQSFSSVSSFATFDVSTVNASAKGFAGGAFDGRYVYLVPNANGLTAQTVDGVLARYDTKAPFEVAASWKTFDVSSVNPAAAGFFGAVFDGRYLYLIPQQGSGAFGMFARYDTTGPLDAPSSYTFAATPTPSANCFTGGTFDGRYVYFTPGGASPCAGSGYAARYDTQGTFADAAAWKTFALNGSVAPKVGFLGASFDGRYVYLAPGSDYDAPSSLAGRYDTHKPFDVATSWTTFDLKGVDVDAAGFAGSAFDGRYVYFAPSYPGTGGTSPVVRFDTTADFGTKTSWEPFKLKTAFGFDVQGFQGAVFDGQSVYFVPHSSNTLSRFHAKTPPLLPVGFNASFF